MKRRNTDDTGAVYRLLYAATHWEYGLEMAQRLNMPVSTVYNICKRFVSDGWAETQTELMGPKELGRRRRTYYRLTDAGRAVADQHKERGE